MELNELIEELKKYIKGEDRFKHSIGVSKMAKELAKKYGIDEEKAAKCGLMHDMAKEISEEECLKYAKENDMKLIDIERKNPKLLHGPIGAIICKKNYGFDKDMCNSIKWHTTGRPNMSMLEKIVFVADKIDETRKYDDVEKYRELAFEDIDEAILEITNYVIKKNIDKGKTLSEKSIQTRNYILLNRKK